MKIEPRGPKRGLTKRHAKVGDKSSVRKYHPGTRAKGTQAQTQFSEDKEAHQTDDQCWWQEATPALDFRTVPRRSNNPHGHGDSSRAEDQCLSPVGKEFEDIPGVVVQALMLEGVVGLLFGQKLSLKLNKRRNVGLRRLNVLATRATNAKPSLA